MALKDILVYLDQTDRAIHRLRLAADLARRHASRLTALYVRERNADQEEERKTAELGLASAQEIDRLNQRAAAAMNDVAARLRSVLDALQEEHGLETVWRAVDGTAATIVPQHARYADLCVLGQDSPPDRRAIDYSFSEQVLFLTGRPVLFIPADGTFATLGRNLAVGWNSSRPAARAVHDALPLIERAERTTLLTVNPSQFFDQRGMLPRERMVEHLSCHSASIEQRHVDGIAAGSIAATLQAEARKAGADLLVVGAFGHAKLWEKLLGGVTRDLLETMSLPLFMSH
jgi:nucleotide-binding universal stress UspA family protein